MSKITTLSIRKLKGVAKVVCVTAYDAAFAALADQAGVDLILVGDSMGNNILGFPNTIPVTADMMAHHTAAVARAHPNALVVADLPFACSAGSFDVTLGHCARFVQESGADAVKIEGGAEYAPVIKRLVSAGIPIMGHIGLLPQRVNALGRYRRFGKTAEERASLLADAKAVEEAGAFCIVAEMLTDESASEISAQISVPLIGIGSGPHCDGQIIVCTDILGLTQGAVPSFSKQYADIGSTARSAFAAYAGEVRDGAFPVIPQQKQ